MPDQTRSLKIGELVLITRLKRHGTLLAITKGGKCKVLVDDKFITCSDADLEPAPPNPQLGKATSKPQQRSNTKIKTAPLVIDLHGCTTTETTIQVQMAVNRAIMDGYRELQIIHGIGTGKVRTAVEKSLTTLEVVKSFKLDPNNPGQTRVFF